MDEDNSGLFNVNQTVGNVKCCKCGISMSPNTANMCMKCLRLEIDITEGLLKNVRILYCPECCTYLQPPKSRIRAEPESRELLIFCLKKLNLAKAKVTLAEADFAFTESHSKRVIVKLQIRKEVLHGAILEQGYQVEYVVHHQTCHKCSKLISNPDQWGAKVQLRQHVSHRRTFLLLEQLILKHDYAADAIRIKQVKEGIDFFFANKSNGVRFVEDIRNVVPVKFRNDRELMSHDTKSNTYTYRYTFSRYMPYLSRGSCVSSS